MSFVTVKRAIISVSDKKNLIPFVKDLVSRGVEILSTGGTAKLLQENNIKVTKIEDYMLFPEIMEGRVKTLHPRVHGGLLGRLPKDQSVMDEHGILAVDLLVVNLYPFKETISADNCRYEDAIEQIDIGGPAMLRAGAKNHERVSVVVDPADYDMIIRELTAQNGQLTLATRKQLAAKVFAHTASYDASVASYLTKSEKEHSELQLDNLLITSFKKKVDLRYGENPHQSAAVYVPISDLEMGVASATLLQGKMLSYNNLADADAALSCVYEYDDEACVIVKHANPCGIALGETLKEAYERAYACDPVSAFGGVIAFNRTLNDTTAQEIIKRQFVEVIIAPSITQAALSILAEKPNIRVLALGEGYTGHKKHSHVYKRISGGLLVQSKDIETLIEDDLKVVTKREPTSHELHDLLFAWRAVKHVKSNAIVLAKDKMTYGIGCGQTSRVHSSMIASIKAGEQSLDLMGAVMASDAFFPFRDGLDYAAEKGIQAVIQPGGSIRDAEIIEAANEYCMAMIFTNKRHFNH